MYRRIFARKSFFRFNRILHSLSLHGLGMLNPENDRVSGERSFLIRHLRGTGPCVVFDVGANEGAYARQVRGIRPEAQVYSFEPHPKTFQLLKRNAEEHGFLAFNVACGSAPVRGKLYDYAHRDGSVHASMYREVIEHLHAGTPVEHAVDVITLDDFAAEHHVSVVDLLKIDVEGNELDVVKGFLRSIEAHRVKAIQFEFNDMNVSSRVFFKDFYDLLPAFEFHRMLPGALIPLGEYNALACEIFAYQNIVALPRAMR